MDPYTQTAETKPLTPDREETNRKRQRADKRRYVPSAERIGPIRGVMLALLRAAEAWNELRAVSC